ncbi:hypothetical protein PSECIP111951_00755 [Pseudoalteromonas holothuriae]|uniref:Uncharacterized protein n=1 Tax=Pseudoalteromonas holothuriae TaxID=2963714 RepID=A0A9W4VYN1_9GAMM|nr:MULTISPECIES: hypothetical protein [unclassified Pseudoalteromonas]CAH9053111.1 hypothetical protein PSECIP111951_00755 [Pseudoalteromonas sp. CIP111951]CAH9056416.1 hypothetical protein PSECIP111854_01788 [Pseudoalteromonas sp. CIP111854]
MSQQYRVAFVELEGSFSAEEVVAKLSTKLKINPQKASAFLANKPLFAPADKTKCLKQVKLLASMGVQAKLIALEDTTKTSAQEQKDERVFEALDYITSSLIRIEERLEELEQRLPASSNEQHEQGAQQWQEDEIVDDFDLDLEMEPTKKLPTRKLQYALAAVLLILLIVLALAILYPQWFNL